MSSEASETERLTVGEGAGTREIAVRRRVGGLPGLIWLTGYAGHMAGEKATAIDAFAVERGFAFTRFDFSGHGESGGTFAEGTISRWLEEAEAVFATTLGPQIFVASSMGGWIALLLATAHFQRGDSRVAGLVLIAPATDMTEDLMWKRLPKKARAMIETSGVLVPEPGANGQHGIITRALIEDGRTHLFGDRPIEVGCPVHILQGMEDKDVPPRHAAKLVERLASDDVVLTLVKDGDHRLSRLEDIQRLTAAIDGMIAEMR